MGLVYPCTMNTHMGEDPAARSTRRAQQLQHSHGAEQQTPANPETPSTFPEPSHRTGGEARSRAVPWFEPAQSTRRVSVQRRQNTQSRAKCSHSTGVSLRQSRENTLRIMKKKKKKAKNYGSNFRNADLPERWRLLSAVPARCPPPGPASISAVSMELGMLSPDYA